MAAVAMTAAAAMLSGMMTECPKHTHGGPAEAATVRLAFHGHNVIRARSPPVRVAATATGGQGNSADCISASGHDRPATGGR